MILFLHEFLLHSTQRASNSGVQYDAAVDGGVSSRLNAAVRSTPRYCTAVAPRRNAATVICTVYCNLQSVLYSMVFSVVAAVICGLICTSSLLTLSLLLVTAVSANVPPLFAPVSRRRTFFSPNDYDSPHYVANFRFFSH